MKSKLIFSPIFLKLTAFILICVSSLLCIEIVTSYSMTKNSCLEHVKEKHELNISKISFMLSKTLWDYDTARIKDILDKEILIEDVVYIRLSDYIDEQNQLILYEQIKDKKGQIKVYDEVQDKEYLETSKMLSLNADIIFSKKKIGELNIVVNAQAFNKEFRERFGAGCLHSLVIFILLPILLFLGCNILFLVPLKELTHVVKKFSRNNLAVRLRNLSRDEIGVLGKTFNEMADSIESKNNQLLKQLYYDNLTGLPNRIQLLEDLQSVNNGVIFIINVDSFREINDFYGHEVGDEILKEIASRMQQVKTNSNITIYRLQADEFVLLMKRDSMETNKNRSFYYERNNSLYNEIRSIIGAFVFLVINDKVFICNESEINISATVGAAKVCDGTGHKALYNADMALKKAKQMRKHYLLFDETMEIAKEYENNIKWTFILKEAVANDQIVPFYQPIINNKTGKIEKYECLCRLVNSNNDIISPYYFLDIAKKIRLYPNITRRILIKSFEKFADLPYEFSINVSVFDIQNEETRHCIKSILLSNQDVAKRAVFELLESDGIENYDIIKAFIEEVKSFGCKVAIDDFGSGYSNFDHVMSLDVDVLKIDASMIKNLDKELSSQIITRTIVNFTKELNIKTVSEFVHTPEVFKKVQEFGIDYSQGYLFGEPAPDVCKNDKVSLIF